VLPHAQLFADMNPAIDAGKYLMPTIKNMRNTNNCIRMKYNRNNKKYVVEIQKVSVGI
jgi:hypothetical protein